MIGPVLISLRGNMEISAVTHAEVTQLELSMNLRKQGERFYIQDDAEIIYNQWGALGIYVNKPTCSL